MTETMAVPQKTIDDLPSPPGMFIVGDAPDFMGGQDPWDVMLRYARKFGPIARVDLPRPLSDIVLVSDPDAITQIMVTETASYYKKTPTAALRPVSTDEGDVFTQPGGAVWAARKASNPMVLALQGDWMGKALPAMQRDIATRVESWVGKSFDDTYDQLLHMAFDVFSTMLYGEQFDAETFRDWKKVASELNARMLSKLPTFMLGGLGEEAQAAQDHIQNKFVGAVRAARADPDKTGTDLLRHALRSGCDHPDDLLATELANMYYGGIVSSSTAVAVTLYLLGKSDAEKEKVIAALVALGPDPSAEAISGCAELQAAVLEALRILPPVSLWTRNVDPDRPATLGGYVLPPDTSLMIGSRFAHLNAAHWEQAETYQPARWTAERRTSDPLGSAWFFPFGRGERTCFAQDVALAYIHLAVGTILLRTDPHVGEGRAIEQDFWFGTMVPKQLGSHFAAPPG